MEGGDSQGGRGGEKWGAGERKHPVNAETTETRQKPAKNSLQRGHQGGHQVQHPRERGHRAGTEDRQPLGVGRWPGPMQGSLPAIWGGCGGPPQAYLTSWLIWRSRRWRRSSSCSMGLSSGNSYGAVRISFSASERQNSSCPEQPCHELCPEHPCQELGPASALPGAVPRATLP